MRFAPLRVAQRIYASCAPTISSRSSKHISAISGRQYGQISRSVRHASARLTVSAISWRGALRSAPYIGAVYIGAANSGGPVRAISVRSACGSTRWSSSVDLPCCGVSHQAINERTPSSHLISAFSILLILRFCIAIRANFHAVLCAVFVATSPAQRRRALRGSGARSATSAGAGW